MKIPLMMPIINKEMEDAVSESLRNEKLVLGESVYKFEEKFAKYIGTKHAISTNSGTMALALALNALGIKKGDKVVTSTMSFIATANSILHNNAIPILCDIDGKTGNIDPQKIKINGSRAIIPVHLYGNICDMDKILELKDVNRDIMIIEDASQAHGAVQNNKKAGNIGDIGCFSFYSTKNMTVGGDGGIITTNDEGIAKRIRKLTDCGRKSKYEHDVLGFTARLNTINAAIGLVQLKYLDSWNENRMKIAEIYKKNIPKENQINYSDGCVYYTYTIKLGEREKVANYLENNGIQTGVYYPLPIHLQPIYKKLFNYKEGCFPVAEKFSKEILSLPMHPQINEDEANFVCEKLDEALNKSA